LGERVGAHLTEVNNANVTLVVKEKIVELYIAVYYATCMAIC